MLNLQTLGIYEQIIYSRKFVRVLAMKFFRFRYWLHRIKNFQALTLIIATFDFYSDFFITFDRSNWRRIIRDAMDGTHPKVI